MKGSETFQTVSIMIVNDADGKVTSSEVTSFTTNYTAMIINNSSNTSFTPSTTNGSITISHSDTSGSSNNTVKYILVVNPNSAGS
jgi:hypothetical protein